MNNKLLTPLSAVALLLGYPGWAQMFPTQNGTSFLPGSSTADIRSSTSLPMPSDSGDFRIPCYPSHVSYDDPFVYPGVPNSAHEHMFVGNTLTDFTSTPQTLIASGNSTCAGGTLDRSAYWFPTLHDPMGHLLIPISFQAYYKSAYTVPPATIQPLPAGLMMKAGDSEARPDNYNHSAQNWSCDMPLTSWQPSIPDCASAALAAGKDPSQARVLMTVRFPQCWDGKTLYARDMSNMTNPVNTNHTWSCPTNYPVPLAQVSFIIGYHAPYDSAAPSGTNYVAGYHLSSDAYDYFANPGGLSAHGDWINGWDQTIINAWNKNCVSASKDCHDFLIGAYNGVNSELYSIADQNAWGPNHPQP